MILRYYRCGVCGVVIPFDDGICSECRKKLKP